MVAFEPQYIYIVRSLFFLFIVRGILDRMMNGFQCFNGRILSLINLYCSWHIRSDDQWLSMFQGSLLNPSTFILSAADDQLLSMFQWSLLNPNTLGLFTVAILEPFSGHFQTHFWVIFEYLAEEQTKGS